jgi:hypothetical protein
MRRWSGRWIFSLALAAGLAAGAPREAEEPEPFPQLASARDYPDAGAVVLRARKTVVWLPDGRLTEDFHTFVHVLQAPAAEKYGVYRVLYRPAEQELRLLKAVTWLNAEEFVPADAAAMGDRAPEGVPDPAGFTAVLERVVALPDVAPNRLLEVRVERTTAGASDGFGGVEFFQADDPVRDKRLHVGLPAGAALKYRVFNGDFVQSLRHAERDRVLYSFFVRDVPAAAVEPFAPPLGLSAARLVYSSFASWREAAAPFATSYWHGVDHPGPLTAAKAAALAAGAATPREKARRLFHYVTRETGLVPVDVPLAGLRPAAPDDVLAAGSGDAKDRAVLLGSLLAAAGLEAAPVFLNRARVPLAEDVPAMEQFDTVVLRLERPGEPPVYLDPLGTGDTFGYCAPAVQNRGLLLGRGEPAFVDTGLPPDAASRSENRMTIQLDAAGGADIEAEAVLGGEFAARAREMLGRLAPAELDEAWRVLASRWAADAAPRGGGAEGLAASDGDVALRQSIRREDLTTRQGDVVIIDTPSLPMTFAEVSFWLGEPARRTPLDLGLPARSRTVTEIRLPPGAEVLHLPAETALDTPEWSARRTFGLDAAAGVIRVEETVAVKQRLLPAAAYPATRAYFAAFTARPAGLVIYRLKTGGNQGAGGGR